MLQSLQAAQQSGVLIQQLLKVYHGLNRCDWWVAHLSQPKGRLMEDGVNHLTSQTAIYRF